MDICLYLIGKSTTKKEMYKAMNVSKHFAWHIFYFFFLKHISLYVGI